MIVPSFAGDLELAIHVARVIGGHQVIAAILGPLDRAAETARGERNEKVLRKELAARAEAAADVELDHVDGALGQVQQLRQNAPAGERRLGRALHRHAALRPSRRAARAVSIGTAAWRWT